MGCSSEIKSIRSGESITLPNIKLYRKFVNFARILFSRIALRHICDGQNSQPGHDLHISVNDRVISPYRESFIFTKFAYAKFRENKTLAKISKFTVIHCWISRFNKTLQVKV